MPTFLPTQEQDPLGTPLDMGVEPVTPPQEQEPEDKPNVFADIMIAPFRGLLGAADNTYDLLDYTSNYISGGMLDLPDVNMNFLGQSKTWQGGLVQGISQFATGFIPFLGVAGKLGQTAKLGKAGKALFGGSFRRSLLAGAAADFTVFASNEARLSNLLQAHPALQIPVVEYLAASEDDTFIEGRLKNALEGMLIGGAFEVFLRSLKLHKAFTKARAEADSPEDIIPELLRRPDAQELFDPESFIGPIRNLEAEDAAARAGAGGVTEEVAPEVTDTSIVPVETAGARGAAGDVTEDATALAEGDYFKVTRNIDEEVKFSEDVDIEEVNKHIDAIVGEGIGRGGRPELSTTNDTYGFLNLINRLVKARETVKPKPETVDEVLENAQDLIQSLPGDMRDVYAKALIKDDIATLTEIRNRITAFRLASEDVMADLTDVIIKQSGKLGEERTLAIVSKHMHDLYEMSALESQVARQFGKGLKETDIFRNNKSPFNVDQIKSGSPEGAQANMRAKSEDAAREVIRLIQEGGDPEEVLNQVLNLSIKSRAGFFEMTREYYLQNLLGSVPTMVVNGLGGALATTIDMFEKSIGALMTGNPELAKAVWKHAYDAFLDQNIWKAAGLSFKEGKSRLMGRSRIAFGEAAREQALTAENIQNLSLMQKFGVKFDEEFAKKVDTVFGAFRYPFKVLTGTDEVVRQLNARRAASYKAFLEAQSQNIKDPKQIADYVETRLRSVIDADHQLHSQEALYRRGVTEAKKRGLTKKLEIHTAATKYMKDNFDPETSALAKYAADVADELAFTKDLTKGSLGDSIYKTFNRHPSTAFILPFIKTPLNILGYSADRTLLGLRNFKPFLDELNNADPLIRNAAIGRLTTTISALAGLVYGINTANREGFFHVSGGGPRDIERRKRLEETGWQAYSIKVGDKWISYQRLDPFATIIGLYADIGDMAYEGEFNVTQGSLERLFIASGITLQRNILNKSYMASLNQFMTALTDKSGTKMERFLGNLSSNLIPASGLLRNTVGGIGAGIMGDHEQKELRNIGDYFLRTLPGQQGKLDPKRNLLGEVKEYGGTNYWRAFMPINLSFDKGDAVMKEIAELDHGFEQVSPTYKGLVDLTAHRNRDGQSAHDRRLEIMSKVKIDGKTLRQSLNSLVRSAAYKKLNPRSEPGLPSPRIRMINSVLAEYRAKSLDMALREFPELRRFQQQYEMARMQQRQGATIDNLLQTLEF
jgi:hypothetical protein